MVSPLCTFFVIGFVSTLVIAVRRHFVKHHLEKLVLLFCGGGRLARL